MKTIAFYSYKGGVGRSLALAYTARYLAWRNIGVCILDIDLEAPGIVYKFPEVSTLAISKLGVVDYLNFFIHNGKAPDYLDDYFTDVYPENKYGYIKVMNAGKGIDTDKYWNNLSDIQLEQLFYANGGKGLYGKGLHIFRNLIGQIKEQINPDYLFIDSRSGVTISSMLCNSMLPDVVAMFLVDNNENFYGSGLMYNHISLSGEYKVNKERSKVFCAISRYPMKEDVSDISRKLSAVDFIGESIVVERFMKIVDSEFLNESDITIIHSDRNIERNELSVLKRNRSVERTIIEDDYGEFIRKLVDKDLLERRESLVVKAPRYRFTEFDLHELVERELQVLCGFVDGEEFRNKFVDCNIKPTKTYQDLYQLALYERYNGNVMEAAMMLNDIIDSAVYDELYRIRAIYWCGLMYLYDFHNYKHAITDLEIVCNHYGLVGNQIYYHLAVGCYCSNMCIRDECKECARVKSGECDDYTEKCIRDKSDRVLRHIDRYFINNDTKNSDIESRVYLLRAVVYYNLVREKVKSIESSEIVGEFNKSIECAPRFTAYYKRGNYFSLIGDTDRAFKDYAEAISIDEYNKQAYYYRGLLYSKQGDVEKALADCSHAIRLDDRYYHAYVLRGDIYSDNGEIGRAVSDYNKAMEINPDNVIVRKSSERLVKPNEYYKALEINLQYDHYRNEQTEIVRTYLFPLEYRKTGEYVEFSLVDHGGRLTLTDQGRTLKMLNDCYWLSMPEVAKNIAAVFKEFMISRFGADFLIEMRDAKSTSEDNKAVIEAVCRLLRCVSFLNNMDVFYRASTENNETAEYKFNTLNESDFDIAARPPIEVYPFPTDYHSTNQPYEFALVKRDDKYFLVDQGKTFGMLDAVFALEEPDVLKNLDAIMNICRVSRNNQNELFIEIEPWADNEDLDKNEKIGEAKYRLFECVSFMDTMRIFYV